MHDDARPHHLITAAPHHHAPDDRPTPSHAPGPDHASESSQASYLRVAQWMGERLLSRLDAICRENGITYFVDAGTALGAVREGGWIPWDDDIDIAMLREDYERFREVCLADGVEDDDIAFSDARSNLHQLSSTPHLLYLPSERNRTGRERRFRQTESLHLGLDIFVYDTAPAHGWARTIWLTLVKGPEVMITARAMSVRQALRAQRTARPLAVLAVLLSRLATPGSWRRLHFAACTLPAHLTRSTLVSGVNHAKPSFRRIVLRRDDFLPARYARFGGMQVPVPAHAERVLAAMYGPDYLTPPQDPAERVPLHFKAGVSITDGNGERWVFTPASVVTAVPGQRLHQDPASAPVTA